MSTSTIDPQYLAAGLVAAQPDDRWTLAYTVDALGRIGRTTEDGTEIALDIIAALPHGRVTVVWCREGYAYGRTSISRDDAERFESHGSYRLAQHRW